MAATISVPALLKERATIKTRNGYGVFFEKLISEYQKATGVKTIQAELYPMFFSLWMVRKKLNKK